MAGTLHRRFKAFVALVVFTGGLALPFVTAGHVVFGDDAACGDAVFAAGTAGPQIAAPAPVRVAGHCAICHWLRTAGSARVALAAGGDPLFQPAELVSASPSQWVAGTTATDRPSRAPPADL